MTQAWPRLPAAPSMVWNSGVPLWWMYGILTPPIARNVFSAVCSRRLHQSRYKVLLMGLHGGEEDCAGGRVMHSKNWAAPAERLLQPMQKSWQLVLTHNPKKSEFTKGIIPRVDGFSFFLRILQEWTIACETQYSKQALREWQQPYTLGISALTTAIRC